MCGVILVVVVLLLLFRYLWCPCYHGGIMDRVVLVVGRQKEVDGDARFVFHVDFYVSLVRVCIVGRLPTTIKRVSGVVDTVFCFLCGGWMDG
jgi:hypothetical protein